MHSSITVQVTIANGASLSDAIALDQDFALTGIQMPADWTTANLTFALSADGATYYSFRNASDGSEYTVNAADDRYIRIPVDDFRGAIYMKVRSGTSGTPVNQGAARTLILVFARVNR